MSEIMKSARHAVLESAERHDSGSRVEQLGSVVLNSTTEARNRGSWLVAGQPAKVCFLVAFVAFTAAGAGWAVNHFLTGLMEVAGMAAVGLFYLSLGLLQLGRKPLP